MSDQRIRYQLRYRVADANKYVGESVHRVSVLRRVSTCEMLSFVRDPLRLINPSNFVAPDTTATSSTS